MYTRNTYEHASQSILAVHCVGSSLFVVAGVPVVVAAVVAGVGAVVEGPKGKNVCVCLP